MGLATLFNQAPCEQQEDDWEEEEEAKTRESCSWWGSWKSRKTNHGDCVAFCEGRRHISQPNCTYQAYLHNNGEKTSQYSSGGVAVLRRTRSDRNSTPWSMTFIRIFEVSCSLHTKVLQVATLRSSIYNRVLEEMLRSGLIPPPPQFN